MTKFKPKNPLKFLYYRALASKNYLAELARPSRIKNYREIPIIINNFNRLDSVKQLIGSLEKRGYFNIFIIDNKSTYPPLLEFYKNCRYKVFMLDENIGMNALWGSGLIKKFNKDYFV